jgi:four helix bundle protein
VSAFSSQLEAMGRRFWGCDKPLLNGKKMRDFKELAVWKKSHDLVCRIYRISAAFPDEEKYGLSSQLRRAAASIPTNIAEGCGRSGDREFGRFLHISAGSASETEYLLLLSYDLKYIDPESYQDLSFKVKEIKRMLHGLIINLTPDR